MLAKKGNPLKIHSKVHFLKMDYSIGFYTGGGNIDDWHKLSERQKKDKLSKDWYVWWSFRNPDTNNLERQDPNIKYGINIHKTKTARLKAMNEIKRELEDLFKKGFSPFNSEVNQPNAVSIEYAFDKALMLKKRELGESSYKDYVSRINQFKTYLSENKYDKILEVDKKCITTYLNSIDGNKNANNTKAVLSSIFSKLSSEGIIDSNFIKEIENRKIKKTGSKLIDKKDIEKALSILEKEDPLMLLYVNIVGYTFWRTIEIVRIKIEDIDFDKKLMYVDSKSKDLKTKIIPDILYNDIKTFAHGRSGRLFELNAKSDIDKRNYMTARFRKLRDQHALNKKLTPYYFRHYRITELYVSLRKKLSVEDAIKELSLITGHTSKAIFNYIHVNDIELPKDYSHFFEK